MDGAGSKVETGFFHPSFLQEASLQKTPPILLEQRFWRRFSYDLELVKTRTIPTHSLMPLETDLFFIIAGILLTYC
jgi:hypothetical protein